MERGHEVVRRVNVEVGDVANELIAMSEEPNVRIMETKAILCRVERALTQQ